MIGHGRHGGPTRRTTLAFALGGSAILATTLAGCAPGRDLPLLPAFKPSSYVLGSGDQLRMVTFGEEQLSGEFRVDDQGRIALPLLDEVRAAGRTTTELAAEVAAALKRKGLLRNPSVAVQVTAYRPVFVLGEVSKPGQYPFQPGMTVLTVIAVAGGFTYRAFEEHVSIVRTVTGVAEQGRAAPSAFVAPGDVLNVLERRF